MEDQVNSRKTSWKKDESHRLWLHQMLDRHDPVEAENVWKRLLSIDCWKFSNFLSVFAWFGIEIFKRKGDGDVVGSCRGVWKRRSRPTGGSRPRSADRQVRPKIKQKPPTLRSKSSEDDVCKSKKQRKTCRLLHPELKVSIAKTKHSPSSHGNGVVMIILLLYLHQMNVMNMW